MPNYGILTGAIQPTQTPDMIGGFLSGLQAAKQGNLTNQQLQNEKANLALRQKEIEFLPQKQKMELENFEQSKQMNALNMQAAKQGMTTTSLQQQQLKQQMAAQAEAAQQKKLQFANQSLGSIFSAPEELQQPMLNAAIPVATKNGMAWPKDLPKDIHNPKTRQYLQQMHIQSGQALEQAKIKQEQQMQLSKLPLVKSIDATGRPIYVRQDQAAGMPAYDPNQAIPGSGAAANEIAKALPKVQARQLVSLQDKSAQDAESATSLKNNIMAFEGAISQIPTGTGPQWRVPGAVKLSGPAQNAQQIAKELLLSKSKILVGSLSNSDMANIENSLPTITNTAETNKKIANRFMAAAERAEQKPLFVQSMIEKGIYEPSTINTKWTKFISENPLYDSKTGNVNKNNIENWQKYINSDQTSGAPKQNAQENSAPKVRKYNPETGKIE